MEQSVFRKESLKRVSSPEQFDLSNGDTVTATVTAEVESYAAGKAEVQDGVLTLVFDDTKKAENIEVGMDVRVGDTLTPVMSIGQDSDGNVFAVADTNLPDGTYEARVGYKSTQIIELFFN